MPVETTERVPVRRGPLLADALRRAAPALLAYAVVRVTELAILFGWAAFEGRSGIGLLQNRWDSTWYRDIAEHGYGRILQLDDGRVHSDLAFFPLLPGLEWLGAALTPLRAADVGVIVSAVASLAAAWAIFAIGARLAGPRAGIVLAALWGVVPTAVVQSMGYTESLFTALSAWALHSVLSGRWVLAGTLTLLAGATRPSGLAVVAALWITAAVAWWGTFRAGGDGADTGPVRHRRVVLGVALAPLGWLAYVGFVGVRTGDPFGYFEIQQQWGNGFDGGLALATFVWNLLTGASLPSFLAGAGVCAALGLVFWLFWLCVRQRQPLALLVYAGAILVLSLVGSGYFSSRPRLMMPAFPLLLPPAVALARLSPAKGAAILGALTVGSGIYSTTMFGDGPP